MDVTSLQQPSFHWCKGLFTTERIPLSASQSWRILSVIRDIHHLRTYPTNLHLLNLRHTVHVHPKVPFDTFLRELHPSIHLNCLILSCDNNNNNNILNLCRRSFRRAGNPLSPQQNHRHRDQEHTRPNLRLQPHLSSENHFRLLQPQQSRITHQECPWRLPSIQLSFLQKDAHFLKTARSYTRILYIITKCCRRVGI